MKEPSAFSIVPMPDTHLLADLLEPEEWQALIDAGLIPPDF